MLLSILIPTLDRRRSLFEPLCADLRGQIEAAGLAGEVEIVSECDRGELPTGTKRNRLLARAQGRYVVFVDDDDAVSGDYVARICGALRSEPAVDCVGIQGTIHFRGGTPKTFIHSLRYTDYSSQGGVYTRPPYHLNPMRREIAASYQFLDVYYSEDIEWALRVRGDARLQREVYVDAPLYVYRCRRYWAYQWLLDRTEGLRHRLGLRMTNRFALYGRAKGVA